MRILNFAYKIEHENSSLIKVEALLTILSANHVVAKWYLQEMNCIPRNNNRVIPVNSKWKEQLGIWAFYLCSESYFTDDWNRCVKINLKFTNLFLFLPGVYKSDWELEYCSWRHKLVLQDGHNI